MNHPFMHLLWKSYRSQRGIWLAMLGGMLFLQLLALSNLGHRENPFTVALMMTALIAPAFLCVSTLVMFVMEEEQGTALWLRLLPIKWWQQLSAGLLCSLALTAVIIFLGITVGVIGAMYFRCEIPSRTIDNVTGIQLLTVFPIWIVGLTASVVIRRVLIILPVFGAIGVTNAILTFDLGLHWLSIVSSIVAICMLPFAVRRWQLGRPWTSRIASRPVADATALERSAIETSSFRIKLLRRVAMTDGMQHRSTLVLYWQEFVYAFPFAVAGLLIGIASVIACRIASYPPPLELVWLLFFTLECGLRTFRHDQQKQHGLFWAHRGVSPIKVWLIKNSVWLPLLISGALTVTFLDGFHQQELSNRTQLGLAKLTTTLADPLASEHQIAELWLVNGSRTSPTHLLIAMVTTGYFVAQLCSVWLRPPFVAGFMALLAFIGLPQWIFLCQSDDIPLKFSAWPIVIFCCVATLWSSRKWMDRHQDGWVWTKRIVVLCLLPVGLWLGHQYYRRAQILNPVAAMGPVPGIMHKEAKWYLNAADVDRRIKNPATNVLWQDLMLHGGEQVRPEGPDASQELDLADFPFRCNRIIHDIVATEGWDNSLLPIELRTSWQASVATVVGGQVTSEANRLVRIDQAGDAFDLLCKAVQLTEYLAAQTTDWAELQNCMDALRALHQHIHWCVSSNQVSAQELQDAAEQFEQYQDGSQYMASMLRNRLDAFHQLWSPKSELSEELKRPKKVTFYGHQSWPEEYHKLSGTTKYRHLTLLDSTTFATAIQLRNGLRGITDDMFRWNGQYQRWAKTTAKYGFESDPVLDRLYSNQWTGPLVPIEGAISSRRATWWILQMQVYRRNFGQLPSGAELRRWLVEQGLSLPMRALTEYATNQPYELRLQGSGVTTLLAHRKIGQEQGLLLHANQPVIGDGRSMSLNFEIDDSGHDWLDLPLNKDRVIFVERTIYAPSPVSGALAELIRNKE